MWHSFFTRSPLPALPPGLPWQLIPAINWSFSSFSSWSSPGSVWQGEEKSSLAKGSGRGCIAKAHGSPRGGHGAPEPWPHTLLHTLNSSRIHLPFSAVSISLSTTGETSSSLHASDLFLQTSQYPVDNFLFPEPAPITEFQHRILWCRFHRYRCCSRDPKFLFGDRDGTFSPCLL